MTEEHDCLTCKHFDFEEGDDEHTYGSCNHPEVHFDEPTLVEECPHWESEYDTKTILELV